jgi:Uma2 family endonuclease
MRPVTLLPIRRDGWTVEDLDDLPEDDLRYELVDGTLLVSPPPPNPHNVVANELSFLLHAVLDDAWQIVAPGAIRFDAHNYREPDLLVMKRERARTAYARPDDVLLVVEVMSPSSMTNDRLAKPALYAGARIPHFWRIERDPEPVLITHQLAGDVYRETARFTDEVVIDEPVPLRFRLATLLG